MKGWSIQGVHIHNRKTCLLRRAKHTWTHFLLVHTGQQAGFYRDTVVVWWLTLSHIFAHWNLVRKTDRHHRYQLYRPTSVQQKWRTGVGWQCYLYLYLWHTHTHARTQTRYLYDRKMNGSDRCTHDLCCRVWVCVCVWCRREMCGEGAEDRGILWLEKLHEEKPTCKNHHLTWWFLPAIQLRNFGSVFLRKACKRINPRTEPCGASRLVNG